jgi:peptidoglycan DL-endopeptidase CwlO
MLTLRVRRSLSALAMLGALVLTLSLQPPGAYAAPSGDEGSTPKLREALSAATQAYNDAKGRLDASVQRQAALTEQIKNADTQLQLLAGTIGQIVTQAYRGSRTTRTTAMVLESGSSSDMLDSTTLMKYITRRDDRRIREYSASRKNLGAQQSALAEEIKVQQQQAATMDAKRKEAQTALNNAGAGQSGSGVAPGQANAAPAPRNPDGSWPKESCSQSDPTNPGACLTPRTLHAYNQARAAGYTRYTHCFRNASSGEHPLGRACDFSSAVSTFSESRATGGDKTYGDNLASWLIGNVNTLGVMYIIWYKQIWMPGSGWKSYTGDGTVAGDHYNHVHLSVQ